MEKRIVYQNADGGVTVITPILNSGLTIEQIAAKDVPAGAAYQIVDADQIQSDPVPAPVLNRAQWYVLLNSSAFGNILDSVIAAMPDGPQKVAIKAVAYKSESYSQANTLAILANMRAQGVSGLPSDQDVIDAWADAAQFNGAADLLGG